MQPLLEYFNKQNSKTVTFEIVIVFVLISIYSTIFHFFLMSKYMKEMELFKN